MQRSPTCSVAQVPLSTWSTGEQSWSGSVVNASSFIVVVSNPNYYANATVRCVVEVGDPQTDWMALSGSKLAYFAVFACFLGGIYAVDHTAIDDQ